MKRLFLLFLGVAALIASSPLLPEEAMIGKTAPEIEAEIWKNGRETKIADLKGSVVVLEFWTSYSSFSSLIR